MYEEEEQTLGRRDRREARDGVPLAAASRHQFEVPWEILNDDNNSCATTETLQNHFPRQLQIQSQSWYAILLSFYICATSLTISPGAKLRKSPEHAVSVQRSTSRRPRYNRRRPNSPSEDDNRSGIHSYLRKMARSSLEGDLEEGVEDSGSEFKRFHDQGSE